METTMKYHYKKLLLKLLRKITIKHYYATPFLKLFENFGNFFLNSVTILKIIEIFHWKLLWKLLLKITNYYFDYYDKLIFKATIKYYYEKNINKNYHEKLLWNTTMKNYFWKLPEKIDKEKTIF